MQVFGLPGHVTRNGDRASRLLDAQTPTIEAQLRHRLRLTSRRCGICERKPQDEMVTEICKPASQDDRTESYIPGDTGA